MNSLYSEGCYNLIDKSTRITGTSSTLLDHIYTNISDKTLTSGIHIYDLSDHLPIYCSLNTKPSRSYIDSPVYARQTGNYKADDFIFEIDTEMVKISEHLQCCNTSLNDIFTKFASCFKNILDKHAPVKQLTKLKIKTKCKPWITKGILKSIKTKNKLYYRCFQQKKSCLTAIYKNYLNILTTTKRMAKDSYFMEALTKARADMAKQWSVINEILQEKDDQN